MPVTYVGEPRETLEAVEFVLSDGYGNCKVIVSREALEHMPREESWRKCSLLELFEIHEPYVYMAAEGRFVRGGHIVFKDATLTG